MRRLREGILPHHAWTPRLGLLGNKAHDHEFIMPWPPFVKRPSRPKKHPETEMKWYGPEQDGLRRIWLARQTLRRTRRNETASRVGSLLGTLYQHGGFYARDSVYALNLLSDEFRPAILQAEVVPFLLNMWQHGVLQSMVTESLLKFYEYGG